MRKLPLVFVSFLLLSSLGSAITIESPSLSQYTQHPGISIEVSGAEEDVRYSVNGGENQSSSFITAPQGDVTITFYDMDNGEIVDTSSTEFFVDTEPPAIETRSPRGTIFERSPEIRLGYTDTSAVDTPRIKVTLDGDTLNGVTGQETFNSNLSGLPEGTHKVSFNIPDEHWRSGGDHNATGSWNFTLPVEPVLSGVSPGGVTGDSPELELTARDPSGIDREGSYIEVSGPEDIRLKWSDLESLSAEVENGVEFRYGFDGLEDGEYTVEAHVEDTNGNAGEEAWEFTVDTTPPRISFYSHVQGDVVKGEETFQFNVTDFTGVDRLNISFGGEASDASVSGGVHTATVDTTLLTDGETKLKVTAEDVNDNAVTETISITVDNHEPVVEEVSVYPDPAVGGLEISATVSDSSTSIIGSRYRIKMFGGEETLAEGRMKAVVGEYDSMEEEVRRVVDLSPLNLSSGNYTALLMAEDSAGNQYSWFGEGFQVDNGLETGLEIEDRLFGQEVGTTSTFNVKVSNTGEVDELVLLSTTSKLDAGITTGHKRIQSGETKQFKLEVRLSSVSGRLGNHSISLYAEGLSSSDSLKTELIGQPVSERREEIEARFRELEEELTELNESRQEWSFGGEVEERFETTAELVSEVERLLGEGRYVAAEQKLVEAEENLEDTRSTFTGEVTRERLGSIASAVIKLLAVLAVIGLTYGGYRLIPPEAGYDPEKGYVHRPGGKHPLRLELEHRWRRFRAGRGEKREGSRDESRGRPVERWEGYEPR